MTRAARTARGAFGAVAATLLAAASHSMAGGSAAPIAIAATAILAMPLCIALAGRIGSLWRLSIAVLASQALFHWSFSGLGATGASPASQAGGGLAVSPHAAHFDALASFAPQLATAAGAGGHGAGSHDALMWLAHAAAAVCTIALLHRGEQAATRFLRVLRETVAVHLPAMVRVPMRPASLGGFALPERRTSQIPLRTIRLRGPPASAFSFS